MSELEKFVPARLRAVMSEFGLDGQRGLADVCGVKVSAASNWLQGYNLPRVPEMIRLCEATGIALDWIYRGSLNAMDPRLGLRLTRRMTF